MASSGSGRPPSPPILEAGYDEVFVSQMGTEQEGFFTFWEKQLQPRLARLG